jgi:hypothetical protein
LDIDEPHARDAVITPVNQPELRESQRGRHLAPYAYAEIAAAAFALTLLVCLLRPLLITGKTILTHDNLYWGYPVYQFWTDGILSGHYPFWNPFSHGGEPFYPVPLQFKLLDPVRILVALAGHLVTADAVILFNWDCVIRQTILALGVYLLLRPLASHPVIRISLVPILLYSSFMLGSFRQDGIINQFTYVPFIMLMLRRLVVDKDRRWCNWCVLAALVGLSWQSYFFTGIWILFLFLFVGLLLFRRDLLRDLLRAPELRTRGTCVFLLMTLMMAPNFVLMREKNKFVFPVRMAYENSVRPMGGPPLEEGCRSPGDDGIRMPYELVTQSGTFSSIFDFIQLIAPGGNRNVPWPGRPPWGKPSEAYLYIGLLPWALALWGMIAGAHELKRVWATIAVGFGLLMLGPTGGLHQVLYGVYPPLWFVRHTHALALFFVLALLYFYVIGCNRLLSILRARPSGSAVSANGGASAPRGTYIRIALFCICMVLSVVQAAKTGRQSPTFWHVVPFALGLSIAGRWFFRDIGTAGAFWAVVAAHIVIVLFLSRDRPAFLLSIGIALGLPMLLLLHWWRSPLVRRAVPAAVLACFGLAVGTGDLLHAFRRSAALYSQEPHPGKALGCDTVPRDAVPPPPRSIAPPEVYGRTGQAIRYPELVTRQPAALSPRLSTEGNDSTRADSFAAALATPRWNSFLLARKYFDLVNSGIPPGVMEDMLAIGAPPFQWKRGVVLADEKRLAERLNALGEETARELVARYVLIDSRDPVPDDIPQIPIEAFDARALTGAREVLTYSVGRYRHDDFELSVTAAESGMLYYADGYDSWWQASINGARTPVYRANVNFKAIALPPGTSTVRFTYRHTPMLAALWIFYGTLSVALLAALLSAALARRGSAPGGGQPT